MAPSQPELSETSTRTSDQPPSQPGTAATPRTEYEQRLNDRRQDTGRLARRERVVGNARLGVFLGGIGVAWLAFFANILSPWWLALPVLGFAVLLFIHERVTRQWHRAERALAFYRRGLERLNDSWAGKGQTGERFKDAAHPYSADLDLFGPKSLFELLCTARTRIGEDTLAAWLLAPASAGEVRARQVAVAELAPQLDLREDLALLGDPLAGKKGKAKGDEEPSGVDFDGVVRWGAAAPVLTNPWPRWIAALLGASGVATLYGFFFASWGVAPLIGVIFLDLIFSSFLYHRIQGVLAEVERRGLRDLRSAGERAGTVGSRLRLHCLLSAWLS